jgi:predicted transcriptional regulator
MREEIKMTAQDEQKEKGYQEYLRGLFNTLNSLNDQALSDRDDLYKQLATVEDALETVLNWIKLEKNSLRNFETILEWAEILAKETAINKDEIRYRLRVVLQPQVESFTQNLTTCEISALKMLDAVNKDVEKLPQLLKSFQQINFKLLSIIGYEPESKTSHLDLALANLYQGRYSEFEKELKSLNENLKTPETTEDAQTDS